MKAEYAWSGTLGATVHRMPQIGELLPGVWLASGFGGHGINTTAMAGNIVARAIVEGSQAWQAFEPFDLVWAGGRYGRAAVQAHVWYSRAAEDVKSCWRAGENRRICRRLKSADRASKSRCKTSSRAASRTRQLPRLLRNLAAAVAATPSGSRSGIPKSGEQCKSSVVRAMEAAHGPSLQSGFA